MFLFPQLIAIFCRLNTSLMYIYADIPLLVNLYHNLISWQEGTQFRLSNSQTLGHCPAFKWITFTGNRIIHRHKQKHMKCRNGLPGDIISKNIKLYFDIYRLGSCTVYDLLWACTESNCPDCMSDQCISMSARIRSSIPTTLQRISGIANVWLDGWNIIHH